MVVDTTFIGFKTSQFKLWWQKKSLSCSPGGYLSAAELTPGTELGSLPVYATLQRLLYDRSQSKAHQKLSLNLRTLWTQLLICVSSVLYFL